MQGLHYHFISLAHWQLTLGTWEPVGLAIHLLSSRWCVAGWILSCRWSDGGIAAASVQNQPGHQHDPSSMVPEALAGSLRNLCSTVTLCGVVLLEDIWQHFNRVIEQWSHISLTQVPEPKPFRAGSLHTSQQPVSGQNCILALSMSQILSTLAPQQPHRPWSRSTRWILLLSGPTKQTQSLSAVGCLDVWDRQTRGWTWNGDSRFCRWSPHKDYNHLLIYFMKFLV